MALTREDAWRLIELLKENGELREELLRVLMPAIVIQLPGQREILERLDRLQANVTETRIELGG